MASPLSPVANYDLPGQQNMQSHMQSNSTDYYMWMAQAMPQVVASFIILNIQIVNVELYKRMTTTGLYVY